MVMMSVMSLLLAASTQAAADTPGIRNFLRVNETFCTGGQPTLEHLEKLKTDGVRAIINLRQPSEHDAAAEAEKAKQLGLRYVNIPVLGSEPKDAQVEEFLKATDDPQNRPAFIHCGSANRVGAFWMIRRVLRDKWSQPEAEAEALKIGMQKGAAPHAFALRYLEQAK
jgi:uncharacterized protein (TIGR01244 family)